MLIAARNAIMAGKRLPYDAEVEYLESTGTQYVATGLKLTINDIVSCVFKPTSRAVRGNVFWGAGKRDGSQGLGDALLLCDAYSNQGNLFFVDTYNNTGNQTPFSYGDLLTTEAVVSTGALTVNGATRTDVNSPIQSEALYSVFLFAENVAGSMWRPSKMQLHSWQVRRNGTLVRDYIPVRKGTVGYLYDRVSGKLFGNAGTGDFVVGPDKS
jgi:hypothetical protein